MTAGSHSPPFLRQRPWPRASRLDRWVPGFVRPVLSVPLAAKIAGANAGILAVIILIALGPWPAARSGLTFSLLLSAAIALNLALAILALRPLRAMERTAKQLRAGELDARVPSSILADKEFRHLAQLINRVLDTLHNERGRMRDLTARLIAAQDEERARAARELKESAARHLSAIADKIHTELDKKPASGDAQRLEQLEQMARGGIEELREVAQAVYPRALTERGLVAALESLAVATKRRDGLDVTLKAPHPEPNLTGSAAAALYRVAQEAITNAVKHGHAKHLVLTLEVDGASARLAVTDDGLGFDATANGRLRGTAGGLRSTEDRVSLVDGRLVVTSEPGKGTTVEASVPTREATALNGDSEEADIRANGITRVSP